jgi:taurine dioxygenase
MSIFDVKPVSGVIGAEVSGANLAEVDDAAFDEIHSAWMDHCVLLFRNQKIDVGDLVAFSTRFGDLDVAPPNENGEGGFGGFSEVLVLSNVKENGKAIGALGNAEAQWHTDMNYIDKPPTGSVLLSVEVPDEGGDTGFSNMYRALEDLSGSMRQRIEGIKIKHDSSTNSGGYLREGAEPVTDVTTCPGAIHPIVRTHPETRRKALYLGRRRSAYIIGMSLEESELLLDELWAHASQPKYSWHHQWRIGDVVMWDNRCAMHRRDSFDDTKRRIMHRTQIKGDRPF